MSWKKLQIHHKACVCEAGAGRAGCSDLLTLSLQGQAGVTLAPCLCLCLCPVMMMGDQSISTMQSGLFLQPGSLLPAAPCNVTSDDRDDDDSDDQDSQDLLLGAGTPALNLLCSLLCSAFFSLCCTSHVAFLWACWIWFGSGSDSYHHAYHSPPSLYHKLFTFACLVLLKITCTHLFGWPAHTCNRVVMAVSMSGIINSKREERESGSLPSFSSHSPRLEIQTSSMTLPLLLSGMCVSV